MKYVDLYILNLNWIKGIFTFGKHNKTLRRNKPIERKLTSFSRMMSGLGLIALLTFSKGHLIVLFPWDVPYAAGLTFPSNDNFIFHYGAEPVKILLSKNTNCEENKQELWKMFLKWEMNFLHMNICKPTTWTYICSVNEAWGTYYMNRSLSSI